MPKRLDHSNPNGKFVAAGMGVEAFVSNAWTESGSWSLDSVARAD
jgi:hypothetical protein